MRGRAAIGIHNNLAPGQPGIAIGTADHEFARRIDPPLGVCGDPAIGQNFANIGFDDSADVIAGLAVIGVLGGQHDRGHTHRLATFVTHGKLRFRIGAQRGFDPGFTDFGQTAQDRMGVMDRCGHQFRRFIGGETKHNALIACAFVLVFRCVHALGDMGGLFVQQVGDFHGLPVEFVLLIADVANAIAGNLVNLAHIFGQLGLVRQAHLAADNDAVGGGKGFTGHAGFGFFGQKGIQHRI